ncbi:MAG TPA: LptF/LptG family permease [Thermohalobaculum sp.]|nr:LptF/LptG family permease [Thermohalobaculum sp.]
MTVGLYLSRLVGGRILAVLAGFVVLGLSLDLLETSAELIDGHGLAGLGSYALLRAPLILLTVFPLGVLVGAALAFLALAARSEMVVLRAAGINTVRILLRLVPLMILCGVLQSQLAARLGPVAEQALVTRFPELTESREIDREVWLRDWQAIIRIGGASADAAVLRQVSVFETDADGELQRRIDAAVARYDGDAWHLEGASVRRIGAAPEPVPGGMRWRTRLTPAGVLGAARRPDLVSADEVRQILAGERPGARGTPYYLVQLWRSYAALLVPAVMLLFAALAGFGLARSGGGARYVALGLAGGALFVLVDGVFASLGQAGAMRAALAAFIAPAVFFVVGLWSIVVIEE